MDWNSASPLRTGPGRALAMELVDAGRQGQVHALVVGALDGLNALECPAPQAARENVEVRLRVYLRGLAAAAIVADHVSGSRLWTSAADYAVRGEQVEFLEPESVTLGTLSLALAAAGHAMDLTPAWEAHPAAPPLPLGHHTVLVEVQQALALGAQARMTQVSNRAEDLYGG